MDEKQKALDTFKKYCAVREMLQAVDLPIDVLNEKLYVKCEQYFKSKILEPMLSEFEAKLQRSSEMFTHFSLNGTFEEYKKRMKSTFDLHAKSVINKECFKKRLEGIKDIKPEHLMDMF